MDFLDPIVKWIAILGSIIFALFWYSRSKIKQGKTSEKLKQAKKGNDAQERQTKAMRITRARDLLDDLKRVRDKPYRK